MITRDPDVTRLLDRMEKRGLISRSRDNIDRRTVIGRIIPEVLKLLARLDELMQEIRRKQLGQFGQEPALVAHRTACRRARQCGIDFFEAQYVVTNIVITHPYWSYGPKRPERTTK